MLSNEMLTTNLTVFACISAFIFANNDGSVRTYFGSRKIFDGWKKRHKLTNCNIHFHGLRHTFSNMLFEMNENPKVIQQLLGHRDVKTTITVYNSVNSEYVREATDRLNTKIQEHEQEREVEEEVDDDDLSDEEIELQIRELEKLQERKRRRKEKDFEM